MSPNDRLWPAQVERKHAKERPAALHDALEDLLGAVWECEAEWRFDDRIALAMKNRRPFKEQ